MIDNTSYSYDGIQTRRHAVPPACARVCVFVCACTRVCVHVHMHACMCTCVCMYNMSVMSTLFLHPASHLGCPTYAAAGAVIVLVETGDLSRREELPPLGIIDWESTGSRQDVHTHADRHTKERWRKRGCRDKTIMDKQNLSFPCRGTQVAIKFDIVTYCHMPSTFPNYNITMVPRPYFNFSISI